MVTLLTQSCLCPIRFGSFSPILNHKTKKVQYIIYNSRYVSLKVHIDVKFELCLIITKCNAFASIGACLCCGQ